eukprot:748527-Rhodomonas_salina.1
MELEWLQKSRRRRQKAKDSRLNFSTRRKNGNDMSIEERKGDPTEDKRMLREASEELERLSELYEQEKAANVSLKSQVNGAGQNNSFAGFVLPLLVETPTEQDQLLNKAAV